ncbi:hypothetical protein BSKO_10269 [Bryopsis sp. KO-2023]|nr:hypothetical protein BSKO_10269 [Bryopsis sp. KO-2023]
MSSSRKKSKSKSRRRGEGGSTSAPFDDSSMDQAMRNELMARMAQLMTDPAGVAKDMGMPGLEYVGRPVPKEQMLKMHRQARAGVLSRMTGPGYTASFSLPYTVKPKMPRAQIAALRPICVKDLSVGTTHKGCVLDGVILELPVFMSGVHTIAEDKNGEAFMLSVYNIPGADFAMADKTFPVGARVKVLEPFYKAVNSGGFGVRVEDPGEIKVYSKDEIVDYREEGNRLFGLKDFAGATDAYTNGLKDAAVLSICLANASACCLELNRDIVSYSLAVCSLTVNPSYEKAWFRGLTCLSRMERISEARKFYVEAPSDAHAALRPVLEGMSSGGRRTSKTSKPFDTVLRENLESLLPVLDLGKGKSCIGDEVDVDKMKAKGNSFFKKCEFEKALECYLSVIHAHGDDQKLLSNRATCNFKLSKFEQAVVDATTAVVVGGARVDSIRKALFRRASALRELELYESALDTVKFARSEGVQFDELTELERELHELVNLDPQRPRGPRHNQPTHEDEVDEVMQDGTVRGSAISNLNDMLAISGQDTTHILDNRVPKFHYDFFKEGHLPPHCNAKMCQEWTVNAFEESRASPMLTNQILDMKSADDLTPEYILRRLGTTCREDLMWWLTAPIGNVRDRPEWKAKRGYATDALHSFGNVWPRPIDLRFGKTHVGVGYVDLGVLVAANYVGSEEDGGIKFVGYETSVYSTAKTGVLAEMFHMGAPVDCILQVWYSSAWSAETMKVFRSALLGLTKKGSLPKAALAVCKFWLGVPQIPLLVAQEKWLRLHPQHHNIPANLVKKRDRTEVMQYMLTGRLLLEDCEVGSVVMFGNPPDLPHLVHEESVLWLVSFEEISMLNNNGRHSVMHCVVETLRSRISKARALFLDGKMEVDLRLKGVTAGDEKVQRDIAEMEPWTMSWSNLCDYSSEKDFHKMLKACSVRNTVHYMHTMNWLIQVKGTDLNDYMTIPEGFPDQRTLFKSAKHWVKEMAKKSAKGILLSPPVYHPNNIVHAYHAGKFFDSWLQNFLKAGGVKGKQTGAVHVRKFSFFCRAEGNAFFSFTYDDEIRSA